MLPRCSRCWSLFCRPSAYGNPRASPRELPTSSYQTGRENDLAFSADESPLKCRISGCLRLRVPFQRIVLSAIAPPRVEHVYYALQLRPQLRHVAYHHSLQRRYGLSVAVGCTRFHLYRPGTIVVHPIYAKLRVKLRTEARRKEAVAEQSSRCI